MERTGSPMDVGRAQATFRGPVAELKARVDERGRNEKVMRGRGEGREGETEHETEEDQTGKEWGVGWAQPAW
jgi:hypothetical protein